MNALFSLADGTPISADARVCAALETGKVIVLPAGGFALLLEEQSLLSPALLGRAKNISLGPDGRLKHAAGSERDRQKLQNLMRRFAQHASDLVESLVPSYRGKLTRARTSFRPAEIEGRSSSALKDDTRLHVDAFPATPMGRRRILRVFANINPAAPRIWHIGEPFADIAQRFLPRISPRPAAFNAVLAALGATKGRRTTYDDVMLALHNSAKLDLAYQCASPKQRVAFAPGTMWVCFTDQVVHAALKGQYALEQTFHLSVQDMADPAASPLRVLERLMGRALI